MRRGHAFAAVAIVGLAVGATGCSCEASVGPGDTGAGSRDGATGGTDAAGRDGRMPPVTSFEAPEVRLLDPATGEDAPSAPK